MANMLSLMKKNKWSLHCNLCGKNVFENPLDYYMVKDRIWNKIVSNDYVTTNHVLCRYCAEEILGREFVDSDFTDAPINYDYNEDGTRMLKNKIYPWEHKHEL